MKLLSGADCQLYLSARRIGLMLNLAIGLQVVFGSIITALAALAGGKKLAVVISVLGEPVEIPG